jgi:hypothetical protein
MLAGCGGSQTPIGAPGVMPQSRAITMYGGNDQSLALPDAHGRDLLYISNVGYPLSTNIYTYPKTRFVSSLGGGGFGMCSNAAGDVFITGPYGTAEYPHGGATQIAYINAPYGFTYSCSVDPTTGNLAIYSEGGGSQGVAVYRPERHHRWHVQHMYRFAVPQHVCTYDSAGDLFVAGFTSSDALSLVELPKGGSTFETITLDTYVTPQGNIQWDGQYLAIGDFKDTAIHRFAIHGTTGTQVGLLTLSHAQYLYQFWIQGSILIGPDSGKNDIGFWRYPQGGAPLKLKSVNGGYGVTVSLVRQ